ncbi:protein of unknown function [Candidatus Methylomirabilis oxygeniifera]|uniref:Uncharacterized protein n=1 Tax=Methylomirabilis oxygeniifera TaxID=671143 RepID=D5MKV7_METO1|nr:protein of unknown function [Candidatus Methylomirabilis oxyfera]
MRCFTKNRAGRAYKWPSTSRRKPTRGRSSTGSTGENSSTSSSAESERPGRRRLCAGWSSCHWNWYPWTSPWYGQRPRLKASTPCRMPTPSVWRRPSGLTRPSSPAIRSSGPSSTSSRSAGLPDNCTITPHSSLVIASHRYCDQTGLALTVPIHAPARRTTLDNKATYVEV